MMRFGRYWKDQGIVLKTTNFGENDRIVTLFTRKKGKMNAIAKGARKTGNRFGPALDCPAISNFMFYGEKGLPVLSQAEIVDCFREMGKETMKWVFAHYLLFMVDKCYEPEEPDERIYETILQYFEILSGNDNLYLFVLKFRIDLFRYLGFFPRFQFCASCGIQLNQRQGGWSTSSGGIICEKCCREQKDVHFLPPDILAILVKLMSFSCSDCMPLHLSESQFAILDSLFSEYLSYHVGRRVTEWKIFAERFQEVS